MCQRLDIDVFGARIDEANPLLCSRGPTIPFLMSPFFYPETPNPLHSSFLWYDFQTSSWSHATQSMCHTVMPHWDKRSQEQAWLPRCWSVTASLLLVCDWPMQEYLTHTEQLAYTTFSSTSIPLVIRKCHRTFYILPSTSVSSLLWSQSMFKGHKAHQGWGSSPV